MNGSIAAPGALLVQGVALPSVTVVLRDLASGAILATVQTGPSGDWQVTLNLNTPGTFTLVAEAPGANGQTLRSDPVRITLAPSVQPETGGLLVLANPRETGRTFTALLALLFVAGGFSTFFAGRVLIMLARDHLRPR